MIGVYVAGTTVLHRARPGVKLAALLVLTTVLVALPRAQVVTVGVVVVTAGALVGRLGVRGLGRLVWPLRWVVLVLTPVQAWLVGWERAYVVVGGLVVAVTAAGVVSATTRVTDMTDTLTALIRPLRRVGADPDRVGLVLALAIRAVPVIVDALRVVREARAARGMRLTPDTILAPLLIRTIRHADRVGEALAARGLDD
ncbi:MAG: energy-coupling factor transporter transmembrane protein EcfT [Micrococcales bacterium]|nr:energy-coupling factor transporter transmembrane protein EcfT [Micrococcales bacterium]